MAFEQQDLLQNATYALIGSALTWLAGKIQKKTGVFTYHWTANRIALSANDSVFGDVRATWQGVQVRNLHIFTFEVENCTTTDYENVEFRVYSGPETRILNEKTEILGTPYNVPLSEQYIARQSVPPGNTPTQEQLNEHQHNREYKLKAFNRGQKLLLSYICTRPTDDELPKLSIATPSPGIRLKLVNSPTVVLNPLWGVPISAAIKRALLLSVAVVFACSLYLESVAVASIVSMVVGLFGQILGAAIYRAEKYLRNLISGRRLPLFE